MFRTFKQRKVHLAMVVNEYGKVLGLVTMDDLLAQLFGQLRDERDALQRSSSGRTRVDRTPVPGSVPAPQGFGVETGPIPLLDQAALAGDTGLANEEEEITGVGDELPEPAPVTLDPIARAQRLRDLSALEDERTPPPVDLVDVIAREVQAERSDGTPIELSDNATGPSGPVAARRGGGDA
jgi:hypothetical protein